MAVYDKLPSEVRVILDNAPDSNMAYARLMGLGIPQQYAETLIMFMASILQCDVDAGPPDGWEDLPPPAPEDYIRARRRRRRLR